MEIKAGHVYHIKDEYFEKIKDKHLMQNKESGNYRPTYYGMKDSESSLLWVVPMSTRVSKYKVIHDQQVEKYGKSSTIVIGKYDGKDAVFLIQNMFPITPEYISHIHTKRGNPVPVNSNIQRIIDINIKKALTLAKRNIMIVFPDIINIEQMLLKEIE